MKRYLVAACRPAICITLQIAAIGTTTAQSATAQASQMTAMLWGQTANAGAAIRRFIEPAEARVLWDDPEIKRVRTEMENAWDFVAPDGVPGFGPLPPENDRKDIDDKR